MVHTLTALVSLGAGRNAHSLGLAQTFPIRICTLRSSQGDSCVHLSLREDHRPSSAAAPAPPAPGWDGEPPGPELSCSAEAQLQKRLAVQAGTWHMCDLTSWVGVRGEPEKQGCRKRREHLEAVQHGLRGLGESCGYRGMFSDQDVFHLVSPELDV